MCAAGQADLSWPFQQRGWTNPGEGSGRVLREARSQQHPQEQSGSPSCSSIWSVPPAGSWSACGQQGQSQADAASTGPATQQGAPTAGSTSNPCPEGRAGVRAVCRSAQETWVGKPEVFKAKDTGGVSSSAQMACKVLLRNTCVHCYPSLQPSFKMCEHLRTVTAASRWPLACMGIQASRHLLGLILGVGAGESLLFPFQKMEVLASPTRRAPEMLGPHTEGPLTESFVHQRTAPCSFSWRI